MITPEDDPRWPACNHGEKHWCDEVRAVLISGSDGVSMSPGDRVLIPVVPSYDLYAEVSLDVEVIGGMMVKLTLVKTKFVFSPDELLVPLGLHTLGEGRLVIAQALSAWMEGFEPEKCTYHNHSFPQEMEIGANKNVELFVKANRACLTIHDKCFPCWKSDNAAASSPIGGADDYGLGGVNAPRNASNNRDAMDALRSRFVQ